MIIVGIDPGSMVTGIAVLQCNARTPQLVSAKSVRLKGSMSHRLASLYQAVCEVLDQVEVDEVAMEKIFTAHNPQSALKLGQARGVIMLAAAHAGLPVYAYSPTRVKNTTAGHGRASKEDMQRLIQLEFKLKKPLPHDANDAVAIALTHSVLRSHPAVMDEALE